MVFCHKHDAPHRSRVGYCASRTSLWHSTCSTRAASASSPGNTCSLSSCWVRYPECRPRRYKSKRGTTNAKICPFCLVPLPSVPLPSACAHLPAAQARGPCARANVPETGGAGCPSRGRPSGRHRSRSQAYYPGGGGSVCGSRDGVLAPAALKNRLQLQTARFRADSPRGILRASTGLQTYTLRPKSPRCGVQLLTWRRRSVDGGRLPVQGLAALEGGAGTAGSCVAAPARPASTRGGPACRQGRGLRSRPTGRSGSHGQLGRRPADPVRAHRAERRG
eukprot:SAG22_NODE_396_length_11127_cov_33.460011_5_plen_278_part_00